MLPTPSQRAAALRTAATMTDRQAVGQLLMPVLEGADADIVTAGQSADNRALTGQSTPAAAVRSLHLGGVILMGGQASNVDNPVQVGRLTAGLQRAARRAHDPALLVSTDQEQGVVTRIGPPATRFPGNMAVGASGSRALAAAAAYDTGSELRAMGVDVDLAPDADVTAGEGNAVIGSRSFGSDPASVARLVGASVVGYQRAGVAAVAKHFPGHGDTDVDSHTALPVLRQPFAALLERDGLPFGAAISSQVGAVMVGHLDARAVDPGVPASLSPAVVTGLLRHRMGFTGVVMTDAMNMEPVTSRYDSGAAAVHAILAGDDIVVMPVNPAAAEAGLLAAVRDGALTRDRINESVARVLALKRLIAARPTGTSGVGTAAHAVDAAAVARAAVTVLAGRCAARLIPQTVDVVGDPHGSSALAAALAARGVRVVSGAATTIAVTGYGEASAPAADVVVAADTPYLLGRSAAPVRIAAYDDSPVAMSAAADALLGRLRERGRSPVAVTGLPRSACS